MYVYIGKTNMLANLGCQITEIGNFLAIYKNLNCNTSVKNGLKYLKIGSYVEPSKLYPNSIKQFSYFQNFSKFKLKQRNFY